MTDSLARRVLAAGATAAALALIGAAPAGAAGLPDPKVTTAGGQSVITFLSHTESETYTPQGGKPTTEEPKEIPKPGDAFGFEDVNTQDGTKVGTDSGKCVIISATETSGSSHCVVKVTFANGTLTIEGDTTFEEEEAPFTIPITGGTGAYAGAHGTAKVVDVNEDDSNVTLTYTTGSQVSTTPTGGAATGGGIAAETGASSLLALGALGLGAGAILLTAGRKVGRRIN